MEAEQGSRFFGFVPGKAWKPRFAISENGDATYSGSDGIEVRTEFDSLLTPCCSFHI